MYFGMYPRMRCTAEERLPVAEYVADHFSNKPLLIGHAQWGAEIQPSQRFRLIEYLFETPRILLGFDRIYVRGNYGVSERETVFAPEAESLSGSRLRSTVTCSNQRIEVSLDAIGWELARWPHNARQGGHAVAFVNGLERNIFFRLTLDEKKRLLSQPRMANFPGAVASYLERVTMSRDTPF